MRSYRRKMLQSLKSSTLSTMEAENRKTDQKISIMANESHIQIIKIKFQSNFNFYKHLPVFLFTHLNKTSCTTFFSSLSLSQMYQPLSLLCLTHKCINNRQ